MKFDYDAYVKKFRKTPTKKLIAEYKNYNADFRRITREELKKRKVSSSKLPYKKRGSGSKRQGGGSIFGF